MKAHFFITGLVILMFLSCLPKIEAQSAVPQVRAFINDKQQPWVGQKIVLTIELLAPGYFSGTPRFDFPQIPGVLLVPPEGSPVVSTEKINGESYTVQHYEAALFAKRPGDHEIPAFRVRFEFKRSPLDQEVLSQEVLTPGLHFFAKLPSGAENLTSLISAHDLAALEKWQPVPHTCKVGDAFTRTITFTAPGIPGMAFPRFPASRIEGLGVYPKQPIVSDQSERGELRGSRRDVVTYICQRPGHFTVPAAQFTWWNIDDQTLHTVDFPERTFEVAANPAFAGQQSPAGKTPLYYIRWSCAILASLWAVIAFCAWMPWRACLKAFDCFHPVHLKPLNPPDQRA